MDTLVASLMLWIGANSAYDTNALPMPHVQIMTPAQLTAEYYTSSGLPAAARPDIDPRVMALYDFEAPPHGRIYIIDPALTEGMRPGEDPLDNPVFQERLLHELVHHVQRLSGAYDEFKCPAQGEIEAYRLGGVFLERRHADDPLPNRAFWARIYSRC